MLHLLKLEWLKQKEYILFRVLMIAYVVFLPAILMIGKKLPKVTGEMFDPQIMLFHFPSVWEFLGYIGNWLTFFIFGFMAVLIITNEYGNRTLRQNVISGIHRSEWFWSKFLFIAAISLFASLYYFLCSISIGLFHAMGDTIYMSTVFKNSEYTIRYFLMCLGYMSFGMLVGVLVKRTGLALFAFIGYVFFLEPTFRGIYMYLFQNKGMHYFPTNVMEDMCPMPFTEMAEEFIEENGFSLLVEPSLAMVLVIGYILLFGWLSHNRLVNNNL